jgi:polysaccharide export outer membrane protein
MMMMNHAQQRSPVLIAAAALVAGLLGASLHAQTLAAPAATGQAGGAATAQTAQTPQGVTPPADYVIGADDVLSFLFWRDKDMSTDTTVRPDGKIALPLINEIRAGGLTVEQLRQDVTTAMSKFVDSPTLTIVVKQINSRKVFITGAIAKPGSYPLGDRMTITQLIALAGGVLDFADEENISVIRPENSAFTTYRVNYKDLKRRRALAQNIDLKVGDTVIVP